MKYQKYLALILIAVPMVVLSMASGRAYARRPQAPPSPIADPTSTSCLDIAITYGPATLSASTSPDPTTVFIQASDTDADRDTFSLNIGTITSDGADCDADGDSIINSALVQGKDPGTVMTSVQLSTELCNGETSRTYTIPILCFDEKVTGTNHFQSSTVYLQVTVQP